jgi:acetylornithine deacetylase/succinyl-diaminopimelate desuccinylase-like protein
LEAHGTALPFPKAGVPINPEWRLYARSASDDKLGVVAILSAIEAIAGTKRPLTSNIKFFFEGEEEAGSPHLADIVRHNKELLASDAWIIVDGPAHQTGRKEVTFGVRGVTTLQLTVYGSIRRLHSGHYGNWAPNPAMMLAKLLASMKDDNGRVTIAGFYDDVEPLDENEQRAVMEAPNYDQQIMSELEFARPESTARGLIESLTLPSLNVDGIQSADVGKFARNVIPTTANANIDLRLVKGNDYQRQCERVIEHVRRQGYYVTGKDPTPADRRQYAQIAKLVCGSGYNAERTSMTLPISQAIVEAVQSACDQPVVTLPTLGSSLPLHILREQLNSPSVIVSVANYDNNQHAENENVRIQNIWDGIEIVAALMRMK